MREIILKTGEVALVDDGDYALVSQHRWYFSNGYATTYGRGKTISMHRLIMQPPPGMEVDHQDRNGLNNCRANLRVCTHSQNLANAKLNVRNSSGYRGVRSDPRGNGSWVAEIGYKGKAIYLGAFSTPEEAAEAYDRKKRELLGGFGAMNNPNAPAVKRRRRGTANRKGKSMCRYMEWNAERQLWRVVAPVATGKKKLVCCTHNYEHALCLALQVQQGTEMR